MPLKMTLIALAVMAASSQLQADTSLAPPVSLAQSYQDGIDVSEYWYSEKLDGVRAYWTGQHLVTRNGNRIYAQTGLQDLCLIIRWTVNFGLGEVTSILFSKRY